MKPILANLFALAAFFATGAGAAEMGQGDESAERVIANRDASEQQIEETFGDWSRICTAGEDPNPVCQVVQSVNQNESGRLVFQTAVGYVADNDKPIMYLTAPLGIFLPRGISIFVDDDDEGLTATVQRCDNSGCLGVLALDETWVDKLKKGAEGRLVFAASAQQNVSVPLSLSGFTKAFDSLESSMPAEDIPEQ